MNILKVLKIIHLVFHKIAKQFICVNPLNLRAIKSAAILRSKIAKQPIFPITLHLSDTIFIAFLLREIAQQLILPNPLNLRDIKSAAILRSKIAKQLSLTILTSICVNITNAQQPISLKAAIDTALKNSTQIKNEILKTQYSNLLIQTAKTIAPASFTLEAGQINSVYFDTKINAQQVISLPKVYKSQKELLMQEAKATLLKTGITEVEIKMQVATCYNNLIHIQNKLALITHTDSLFNTMLKRANTRLANGETNNLERLAIESQIIALKLQQLQLNGDRQLLNIQFQYLLNTSIIYSPIIENNIDDKFLLNDGLEQHPNLVLAKQQLQINDAQVKVEQAKLLPELIFGLNNTSIKGTGADNKNYSATYRFTAIQAGVAVPIFAKAQKAKIAAYKFNANVLADNIALENKQLTNAYKQLILKYNNANDIVNYITKNALPNAKQVETTATQQLINGAINYIEWVQLINNSITVQTNLADALHEKNSTLINLKYFGNK